MYLIICILGLLGLLYVAMARQKQNLPLHVHLVERPLATMFLLFFIKASS